MNYYELKSSFWDIPNQLYIYSIEGIPPYSFVRNAEEWLEGNPFLGIHDAFVKSGEIELDYTKTFRDISVVSEKLKNLLEDNNILDVKFMPLRFNVITSQPYYAMIEPLSFDCVDEEHSDFEMFVENDPVRPDLAGEYNGFFKLIIDPSKVDNTHIFRIKKSMFNLIVSQTIKDLFDNHGITGTRLIKVTL